MPSHRAPPAAPAPAAPPTDADAATGPGPLSLAGQVVLVTGGGRRVGRAICEELAAAGARIVVHYHRSAVEAEALAARLGGEALGADLRSAAATEALFAAIATAHGRLDALVNSAAIFGRTPFATLTDAEWDEHLATNLTAPMRCTRSAVRLGARAIVNLVDIAAWQPWIGYGAYSVAKAGLLQLTRVLARELAPTVRVNAVAPGVVAFAEDLDEATRQRVLGRVPLGRSGEPADVARAVRFLLTEPFLSGVCLPVDGAQGLR
ncbi:MAG: SDR family oxidoreductase [Polyangia bacterium]